MNGSLLDSNGRPVLALHVDLVVDIDRWEGAITNIARTSKTFFPRQGATHLLRLQDGRHGRIFIDSINRSDQTFVAEFTGKGPLLHATKQAASGYAPLGYTAHEKLLADPAARHAVGAVQQLYLVAVDLRHDDSITGERRRARENDQMTFPTWQYL